MKVTIVFVIQFLLYNHLVLPIVPNRPSQLEIGPENDIIALIVGF
jgi:hypothetical protein